MKTSLKYFLLVILLGLIAGGIWWELNKKRIVKNEIEKAVSNGTDSTYYIHYDSSNVDALSGSAVFYNIVLQSDSLQKQLYTDDTSAVPKTIFNVRIKRLMILGANIPSFLQKNKVEASSIEIFQPVITIVNTGKDEPVKLTASDTLALYEKLTGKFNSIHAGEIKVTDGVLVFAKGKAAPHTVLQGININLKNLKIDSTHNYDNIISYFVKDVVAKVKAANVKNEKAGRELIFSDVEYNAPGRFLKLGTFIQTNMKDHKAMITLSNTRVAGLSTNDFIVKRLLKADSLTTDGGELGFYTGKKEKAKNETLEMDNDFFDEAIVKNIKLGSTTISILNRTDQHAPPLVLKNIKFNASGIDSAYNGTDILELIGKSKWDLSGDGLGFITKDKIYKIDIGPFLLDNFHSLITVKSASVTPIPTQDVFVRSLRFQKDYYNFKFNDIRLTGADVKKLLTDKMVIADEATFKPSINIFNDRTVTPDTVSKVGGYPQQLLQKVKTGIYIKTLNIPAGYVHYKERGALSKKTGDVVFSNIKGTITNFTNIPEYINKNNMMTMTVNCRFNGIAETKSVWKLPLNSPDGSFAITGNIGPFNGTGLNPVIEPLGMGSINSGNISSYIFDMKGNDNRAEGNCTLIYDNLKIKLLKNTGDSNNLQKKKVTTALANYFILDKNPKGGKIREGNLAFKRVTTKTFFNLVWKSLFAGAKTSTR